MYYYIKFKTVNLTDDVITKDHILLHIRCNRLPFKSLKFKILIEIVTCDFTSSKERLSNFDCMSLLLVSVYWKKERRHIVFQYNSTS